MPRPFSWMPPALLLAASAAILASCAADSKPVATEPPVAPPAHVAAPVAAAVVAPAPALAKSEDEDEVTGKSLYQRHCAGCHNDNGDGKGATILAQGKQARSFAQGGFAFGNTPEAIFKTITSGIPGSSLMQPFKSQMDDDERMLVAKYVLTLTPYGESGLAVGSILTVDNRAVFAYGKLPPIHDGLPERPRGLMVGLPGGASFEYRVDDVRLIAMRRGGFVDRTDWNERGGGYLKPLGDVVFDVDGGDPKPWLSAMIDGKPVPIELELVAMQTKGTGGNEIQLQSKPSAGSPHSARRVAEAVFQPTLSEPESFGRRVRIDRAPGGADLLLTVASWREESGFPGAEQVAAAPFHPKPEAAPSTGLWMVLKRNEGFDCIHIAYSEAKDWVFGEGVWKMKIGGVESPAQADMTVSVVVVIVVVHVKAWDEALLTRLSKELAR